MKSKPRILLYGNSVILGTTGASLRRCSQFEVVTLVPQMREAQEIDVLKPDMILFDLEMTHSENVFLSLRTNSNLLLVGVSPDSNVVKLWSGRQLRELSTHDLLEVISNRLIDSTGEDTSPDRAEEDLSMGNEDTLALLDAFQSCAVPAQTCQMHEDPRTVNKGAGTETRGNITKKAGLPTVDYLKDT